MDGFQQMFETITGLTGQAFSALKFVFPPFIPFVLQYEQLASLIRPPAVKLPEPMPPETGAPETTMSYEEFLKQAQRVAYEANLYAREALEGETKKGEVIVLPRPVLKEQYAMEAPPWIKPSETVTPTPVLGKVTLPIPEIKLPEIKIPEIKLPQFPDLSGLGETFKNIGLYLLIFLFLILLIVILKR